MPEWVTALFENWGWWVGGFGVGFFAGRAVERAKNTIAEKWGELLRALGASKQPIPPPKADRDDNQTGSGV